MATRSVATVFGGSGFIGRYVVKRLAARGYVVRVAVRDPEAALFLQADGRGRPDRAAVCRRSRTSRAVARAVEGADLVVNLVGILAEREPGDFQRMQPRAPGGVAAAAAAAGVARLVQISAIGADPASPSRYGRSKAAGRGRRCGRRFPAATILRPSIVFGPEDQFFNRFAAHGADAAVHAGDRRRDPVPAGLCRRRGGCGDGGAGARRRGWAHL